MARDDFLFAARPPSKWMSRNWLAVCRRPATLFKYHQNGSGLRRKTGREGAGGETGRRQNRAGERRQSVKNTGRLQCIFAPGGWPRDQQRSFRPLPVRLSSSPEPRALRTTLRTAGADTAAQSSHYSRPLHRRLIGGEETRRARLACFRPAGAFQTANIFQEKK